MLRHPLARLAVLAEDPAMAAVLPGWIGATLAPALIDPRFALRTGDPLRALRAGDRWDLIMLFDGDPATVRRNRTRTVEFFGRCGAALAPGGMVVVRVGVSDTYLGGPGGRLLAITAATLRAGLGNVAAVPGEEVLLVGWKDGRGPSLDPGVLEARWHALDVVDPHFDPALVGQLVDVARQPALQRFVSRAVAPVDTALHPTAILLAATLAEGRGHPPLVRAATTLAGLPASWAGGAVALLAIGGFLGVRGRRTAGPACAAAIGLSSMGWWLLLLNAWQASVGSVYSEIGALAAAFMTGLVGGSWLGRAPVADPGRRLASLLLAGAAFSLVIAAGVPLLAPRLIIVPALLVGGALGGACFPLVVGMAANRERAGTTALVFAADEAGAAVGATAVGLVGLPWLGTGGVGLAIAAIAAACAGSLLLVRAGWLEQPPA